MRKILLVFALVLMSLPSFGENITGTSFDWPAQSLISTNSIDIGQFDQLSMQVSYAEAVLSTDTVSDGVGAFVTITLPNDMSGLIAARSSATVRVQDYTAVDDDAITIFGRVYTEGIDWTAETSSATTATNLAAALNSSPDVDATSSGSTVTISAEDFGYNNYPLATSDSTNLPISSSTLLGGIPQVTIDINGTELDEDTDFDFVASSDTSATNLANAIDSNSTISVVFSTSVTSNVVTLTEISPSLNTYYVSASTTGVTISSWTPGQASDIDFDNDTISEEDHGFQTGLPVVFSVTSGTPPSNLEDGSTYYVITNGDDLYKLATSTDNAVIGTAIDISTVAGNGSFSIGPQNFIAGSTGFNWEASNDGTNWFDLTSASVSSVTYSSDGNTLWNFGALNYRYLRINFVPPTQGSLDVTATVNGKK